MNCNGVILALFSLVLVKGGDAERLVKRQTDQQCLAVTSNIGRISGECEKSTTACITESTGDGIGTVPFIQDLICPPTKIVRENIYNVLVGCTSQANADIVYAGLCGSTSVNDTELACTDAIVRLNDGTAAKGVCCGGARTQFGSGSQCAGELVGLAEDVGCCTRSVVLQYFFRSCQVDGGGSGLDALLQANGLELPPLCNYTIYEPAGGAAGVSASFMTSFLLVLVAFALEFI